MPGDFEIDFVLDRLSYFKRIAFLDRRGWNFHGSVHRQYVAKNPVANLFVGPRVTEREIIAAAFEAYGDHLWRRAQGETASCR